MKKYEAIVRIKRRERERQRRKQFIKKVAIAMLIIFIAAFLYGAKMKKPSAVAYGYETCEKLWDLADRHCPNSMDKRDFIEEVKKLNNMHDYKVYSERLYQYPIYEEAK